MTYRATSDEERRSLKLATHRTTRQCGGQESTASFTRVNQQTLSDYGNTGNPKHTDTYAPVDVIADQIVDCRERGETAFILEVLCNLAGGRFVRVHGDGVSDLFDDVERTLATLREKVSNISTTSGGDQ